LIWPDAFGLTTIWIASDSFLAQAMLISLRLSTGGAASFKIYFMFQISLPRPKYPEVLHPHQSTG